KAPQASPSSPKANKADGNGTSADTRLDQRRNNPHQHHTRQTIPFLHTQEGRFRLSSLRPPRPNRPHPRSRPHHQCEGRWHQPPRQRTNTLHPLPPTQNTSRSHRRAAEPTPHPPATRTPPRTPIKGV